MLSDFVRSTYTAFEMFANGKAPTGKHMDRVFQMFTPKGVQTTYKMLRTEFRKYIEKYTDHSIVEAFELANLDKLLLKAEKRALLKSRSTK